MTVPRPVRNDPGMIRAGSDNAQPGDPLLDLLARMIRTAHDRERTERGRLTVMDGGKARER